MKLLFTIFFALFMTACSTSYQQVTQVDDTAFLQITGDLDGKQLILNGVSINTEEVESYQLDDTTVTKFRIPVGSHKLEIIENGKTTVKRQFYVTNGNVFEVNTL